MVPVRWILLKNYAKQFQPAFPFNPFYQRWPEIGLEITSRTTIYQVFWGLVSKVFYSPVFDTINLSGGVTLDLLLFTMKEKKYRPENCALRYPSADTNKLVTKPSTTTFCFLLLRKLTIQLITSKDWYWVTLAYSKQ